MKKIIMLVLATNMLHSAAPKPATSEVEQLKQELEATRQALDTSQEFLNDIERKLLTLYSSITSGKSEDIDSALYQERQTLKRNIDVLNNIAWTSSEIESQKAWNTIQGFMRTYSTMDPIIAKNPWSYWGEHEWSAKEKIISSEESGKGTIWKINPELGNFLVIYMQDYTTNPKRGQVIYEVGKVVPSLFGHGIPMSQTKLKKLIEEITKLSPTIGKALQEQFNKRFKTTSSTAQPARMTAGGTRVR